MGIFDGAGASLQQQAAQAIAAKLGIDPAMAETAIGALTRNHTAPGDTVQQSAQDTGLPADMLGQIVSQIGGEGGLGALQGALAGGQAGGLGGILEGLGGVGGIARMLDRDGDGNPLDDIMGMFGKN